MWRQFLEGLSHDENCFVTLTYADEHLPPGGQLEPRDVQLWLKKLRKACDPTRLRYFCVGEYGDESYRPHYHLSVFGVSGTTLVNCPSGPGYFEQAVAETWAKGVVHVAEFSELSAQYVAGYVVKKLTNDKDPRLGNKHPEFSRMSNRPGIGAAAMAIVAKSLRDGAGTVGEDALLPEGDVPRQLKLGRRGVPLGRYLVRRLRKEVGFTDEYIDQVKQAQTWQQSVEMSALHKVAVDRAPLAAITRRAVYLEEVKQRILQSEARARIYKKRGVI